MENIILEYLDYLKLIQTLSFDNVCQMYDNNEIKYMSIVSIVSIVSIGTSMIF